LQIQYESVDMEKLSLKAQVRKILGRKIKNLRKQGILPGNIFGKHVKSQAVSVNEKEFEAVFTKVGETGLLNLMVDSEKRPVLIHNIARHPVSEKILHVDFLQVDLKEKVVAKVPLVTIGEAKAVKDKAGVLLTLLSEVEVEALPSDLPEKIEYDVTNLTNVGELIKVGNLKVSDKVKILTDNNLDIVKVAPLVSKEAEKMAAEEKAAAEAAAAAAAPAVETAPSAEKPATEPVKEASAQTSSQTKPTA